MVIKNIILKIFNESYILLFSEKIKRVMVIKNISNTFFYKKLYKSKW